MSALDLSDQDQRKQYLASKRGDLTAYAAMVGAEFASKIDRLAQLIGTSHELSVGNYKESLLRKVIQQFLPRRYSVGTGFVMFTRESARNDRTSDNMDLWNLKDHYASRQLDIVVYDDYGHPPILQDGDFVVLRPESVMAVVEVKGYLTPDVVDGAIDSLVDFGRKWAEYRAYCSWRKSEDLRTPTLQLMAWAQYVPKSGPPACDGKTLRRSIVNGYRKKLTTEELRDRSVPLLHSAALYDDCIVSQCSYFEGGVNGTGYLTSRGRFVRYGDDRVPMLSGDRTIADLLAAIHLSLETPFNADYSYADQSMTLGVLAHPNYGLTDLDTGEEVKIQQPSAT